MHRWIVGLVALAVGCSPPQASDVAPVEVAGTAAHGVLDTLLSLPASTDTQAVAIVDFDGDGDLDLTLGTPPGQDDRLWFNGGGNNFAGYSPLSTLETTDLRWGDVDGDGDLDLAAASGTSFRIYGNTGSNLVLVEEVARSNVFSVDWGDYDDDGDLDLLVGERGFGNSVWENDNNAIDTNAPQWEDDTFNEQTRKVRWGDYNNDGNLDFVAANTGPGVVRIYAGDGAGQFASALVLNGTQNHNSVEWADYDNDGDDDLAVGAYGDGVRVHVQGSGGILAGATWSSAGSNTEAILWLDADDDAEQELVVANYGQSVGLLDANGTTQFEGVLLNDDGLGAYSLASGDFDGDGDEDLYVGTLGAADLILENDDSPFGVPMNIGALSDHTRDLAWGDLDNDGDLDVATVDGQGGPARVYLNDGSGGFSLSWTSPDTTDLYGVAIGDLDGDGNLDLALAINGDDNVAYGGDGSGTNFVAVWSSALGRNSRDVVLGDINGDGNLDLVFGNLGQVDTAYYYDPLSDTFPTTPSWTSSPDLETTTHLSLGDWNGDGLPELAASWGGSNGPLKVYANNGGTLGGSGTWTSNDHSQWRTTVWGDFTGDGSMDLAAVGLGQRVRMFTNTGGTLTLSATWMADGFQEWQALDAGDFDADGDLDLFAAGGQSGPLASTLFANDGSGDFTSTWVSSPEAGINLSAAFADADGDGDLDVAMSRFGLAPDALLLNQGVQLQHANTMDAGDAAFGGDLADYDFDGDLDLVYAGADGLGAHIWQNQGDGSFVDVWQSDGNLDARSACWGDFDGDGDLDLGVTDSSLGLTIYQTGVLGGTPTSAPMWSLGSSDQPWDCGWADVDGDGDLEIAIANNDGNDAIYQWDGGTAFTELWNSSTTGPQFSAGLDWADWDADGDPDLLISAWAFDTTHVFRNDGNGTFTSAASITASAFDGRWADVDGDGFPDVVLAGDDSTPVQVLMNNGGGGLVLGWSSGQGHEAVAVRPFDFDGDGDLDLAIGELGAEDSIWINDGGGDFDRAWRGPEPDFTQALLAGDLDGDGDDDLLSIAGAFDSGSGEVVFRHNERVTDPFLPNNPTYPVLSTPVPAAGEAVVLGPTLPVTLTLFDHEGGVAPEVTLEYSTVGGAAWFPATTSGAVTDLDAAGGGTAHTLTWDLAADGIAHDEVQLRAVVVRQSPQGVSSRIQRPAIATTSGVFRAYPDCFPLDGDGDGSGCEDDCNDEDGSIYPGAPETPDDSIDQDCSGTDSVTCFVDDDGDGFGSTLTTISANGICTGAGQSDVDTDCDDDAEFTYPGATELCDDIDNNCDDALPLDEWDFDGDGQLECEGDCAPNEATIYAGAPELCNGLDDDCDTLVPADEADNDTDTFRICEGDCDDGNAATYTGAPEVCDGQDNDCDSATPGEELDEDGDLQAECAGDCDETDPDIFTGNPEVCDGKDNDCDPATDDSADVDEDGVSICAGDCDDADPDRYPGNPEVCDSLDNDCDVTTGDNLDADGDGVSICELDCDDLAPTVFPGADELCDGLDNDCDGDLPDEEVDHDDDGETECEGDCGPEDANIHSEAPEGCDGIDTDCDGVIIDEEADEDGDGQTPCSGDCNDLIDTIFEGADEVCDGFDSDCDGTLPEDEVDSDGDDVLVCEDDCDDLEPAIHPGAEELCDGLDTDCDTVVPEDEVDADGDGVRGCEGDCDDDDAAVQPDAVEACDGVDNDCDGGVDDLPECGEPPFIGPGCAVECGVGDGGRRGAGGATLVLALVLGLVGWQRRGAVLLLGLLMLAPGTSFATEATVFAEDLDGADALLERRLKDRAPAAVTPIPEASRLAGAWILGVIPETLCPTPSVPGDEITTTLARAQQLIDELEVEQGLAKLAGLRRQLGCLTDPVDTDSLYSLHFLEAVAANYSAAPEDAKSSLARALAIRPGQAFDDSYPPELREVYATEQERILKAGRAHVAVTAADLAWIDGLALGAGATPVTAGEHLLQVRGGDGLLRGGLVTLQPAEVTAVGTDGTLIELAQSLDSARRAELGASLADGHVWVADAKTVLPLIGNLPDPPPIAGATGRSPIFLAGLGGGWQMAGTGAGHQYGTLAFDASLRLVGPLRVMVHVRPSLGAPVDGWPGTDRTYAPLLVAFGVGPIVRFEGKVSPRFGAALQLSVDKAPGAEEATVVVGVFGTAGVEIGLGSSPLALRPSFEGGFMGRHAVVRGLLQVVIAP